MKGWSEKTLDELGSISRGRSRHRPRDAEHLYGGPYPFIQTADVKHANLYVDSYSQTYSDAGLAQSKLWEPGTLCITIAANIAETAILKMQSCFPDSIIGFIPHRGVSDARFIKYLFDAMLRKKFQAYSKGSTQDNLSQEKILSLKFLVPHFKVQQRIADILSAYDDLIENNCRRIQLLEESARMLYKEWFVRLRFPGHEHVKVVNGVPEGWERKTLGDICINVHDAVDPMKLSANTPYIGLEHMPRRSISLGEWGSAEAVTSTKLAFRTGDILFGKIRSYFHKVGITFVDGITSSDAVVLSPSDKKFRMYVLTIVSSDEFVKISAKTAKQGSKMPRADWNYLMTLPILLPKDSLLESYNENIYSIVDQLKALSLMNRKLAQARDLLLPKLMNGEVAV